MKHAMWLIAIAVIGASVGSWVHVCINTIPSFTIYEKILGGVGVFFTIRLLLQLQKRFEDVKNNDLYSQKESRQIRQKIGQCRHWLNSYIIIVFIPYIASFFANYIPVEYAAWVISLTFMYLFVCIWIFVIALYTNHQLSKFDDILMQRKNDIKAREKALDSLRHNHSHNHN